MLDKNEQALLCAAYGLTQVEISALGEGHINGTYLVQSAKGRFVLQKLNTQVFKKPNVLAANAAVVERHFTQQVALGEYPLAVCKHVKNHEGEYFTELGSGCYRLLAYIENNDSFTALPSLDHAWQYGFGIGCFNQALWQLNPADITPSIPNFHHLPLRVAQLESAFSLCNKSERKAQSLTLYEALMSCSEINDWQELTNALPTRIIHADTKLSNVLFKKAQPDVLAVIDLDTIMPGFAFVDYADMIRSAAISHPEDSKHTPHIDIEAFSAITSGYLTPLKAHLSDDELLSLSHGLTILPLMLAMRFLADYLNGDTYFKTHFAEHNLVRAQNQYAVYLAFQAVKSTLKPIIWQAAGRSIT